MKKELYDIEGTKVQILIEVDADDFLTKDDKTFLEHMGPDAKDIELSTEQALDQIRSEDILELAMWHIKKKIFEKKNIEESLLDLFEKAIVGNGQEGKTYYDQSKHVNELENYIRNGK